MDVNPITDQPLSQYQEEPSDASSNDLILHAGSQAESFGPNDLAVRVEATAIPQLFGRPVCGDPTTIDESAGNSKLLKIFLPRLIATDYLRFAADISRLYFKTTATVAAYDRQIGCYAMILLHKQRAQSEISYKEILARYEITEKHALHTEQTSKEKLDPREDIQIRTRQLQGMNRIVDEAKVSQVFRDVFIPSVDDRMQLGEFPESIACNDKIIFVYKFLDPEDLRNRSSREVLEVTPSPPALQQQARQYYDNLHRSMLQRLKDFFSSKGSPQKPSLPPRVPDRAQIEEVEEAPPVPATRRIDDQVENNTPYSEAGRDPLSFFYKVLRGLSRLFSAVYNWLRNLFCR